MAHVARCTVVLSRNHTAGRTVLSDIVMPDDLIEVLNAGWRVADDEDDDLEWELEENLLSWAGEK